MSKTNTTNSEDKMLTEVLYFNCIDHGNVIEFHSTIDEHFDDQKLKDEYLNNKDFYDALQHIFLFINFDMTSELLECLKKCKKENDLFTFTFNYTKFIEKCTDLKDKLVKFFNDIYGKEVNKYYDVIELFCYGNLDTELTLHNKLKRNEDTTNEL